MDRVIAQHTTIFVKKKHYSDGKISDNDLSKYYQNLHNSKKCVLSTEPFMSCQSAMPDKCDNQPKNPEIDIVQE